MKGWGERREGEVRGEGEGQRGKERGAWNKDGSGGMRSEGWRAEWELRESGIRGGKSLITPSPPTCAQVIRPM